MKLRLYLDEDSMRLALVEALRARGVEVSRGNYGSRGGHG